MLKLNLDWIATKSLKEEYLLGRQKLKGTFVRKLIGIIWIAKKTSIHTQSVRTI